MKELLKEVTDAFSAFISWPNYDVIPVIFGACTANLGEGDPIFMLLVGAPSTGKTELLRGFRGLPRFYELSKVTEHTFISGFMEKGKKKGSESSLLNKLTKANVRNIMIKDFTSLLSQRPEVRANIFAQIREIADGYCSTPFGTGEDVRWEGKIGFVAGVTGAIDESFSMRQNLGERFLQIRIRNLDPKRSAIASEDHTGLEEALRDTYFSHVKRFMEHLDPGGMTLVETDPDVREKLYNAAIFLSLARTGVSRDHYSKQLLMLPEPEGPGRIIRQLTHLGRGIAICMGKPVIDEEVYRLLARVVRDTIPAIREQCIFRIWKDELGGGSKQTTEALAESLNHSKNSIWTWLDDLKYVGLLRRILQNKTNLWSLSEKGFELIQHSEVFGPEVKLEEDLDEYEILDY